MSTLGPVASTATLRAGWRVIGRGIREEKGWVGLAVAGATVYGIMTVGTAWIRVLRRTPDKRERDIQAIY